MADVTNQSTWSRFTTWWSKRNDQVYNGIASAGRAVRNDPVHASGLIAENAYRSVTKGIVNGVAFVPDLASNALYKATNGKVGFNESAAGTFAQSVDALPRLVEPKNADEKTLVRAVDGLGQIGGEVALGAAEASALKGGVKIVSNAFKFGKPVEELSVSGAGKASKAERDFMNVASKSKAADAAGPTAGVAAPAGNAAAAVAREGFFDRWLGRAGKVGAAAAGVGAAVTAAGFTAAAFFPGVVKWAGQVYGNRTADFSAGFGDSLDAAKQAWQGNAFNKHLHEQKDPLVQGLDMLLTKDGLTHESMTAVSMMEDYIGIIEKFLVNMFPALKPYLTGVVETTAPAAVAQNDAGPAPGSFPYPNNILGALTSDVGFGSKAPAVKTAFDASASVQAVSRAPNVASQTASLEPSLSNSAFGPAALGLPARLLDTVMPKFAPAAPKFEMAS